VSLDFACIGSAAVPPDVAAKAGIDIVSAIMIDAANTAIFLIILFIVLSFHSNRVQS
jgi:hypothetical protein